MTKGKTIALICVLVLLAFLAFFAGVGYYWIIRDTVSVKKDSVLEVVLGGGMDEVPSQNPLRQLFESGALSIWELRRVLQEAAQEENIQGIYLEIHPLAMNWAQLEELRDYLHDFRSSGKKVHCFLAVDIANEAEMYLASAADSITLNPDAGLLLNGLMAEITFFKRTLEKLRVKPDFLQFKEYKSPEVYTREEMTPEVRGMYEALLTDIQSRFLESTATDRAIEIGALQQVLATGMAPAPVALEQRLIDSTGYKNDVHDKFLKPEGEEDLRTISASAYLKTLETVEYGSGKKVAVVSASGAIIVGKGDPFDEIIGATTMTQTLRRLRKDDDVRGVILRVDSPGGSAVGSDMIWQEVELIQKSGKPVIVSMAGVAGSGGYYIAMGADKIVCQPSTITGSIGVIFGKFDISGLADWLGMDVEQVKVSPNADLFSAFSSLNEEQRNQVRLWMETIYQNFVEKAAQGRGTDFEQLEPKARGRVYTGAQALESGLVDALGGVDTAVDLMRQSLQLGEDEDLQLVLYPRPKSLWETLAQGEFPGLSQMDLLARWLRAEMRVLTTPAPWLLTPEMTIY